LRAASRPVGGKEGLIRWRWDRRRQQADQAASAADQTAADADQSAADTDQSASDQDQIQADADQRSSERDQAAADRDLASRPAGDAEMKRRHELSRTERAKGTLDRHAATLVRAQVSLERDALAKQRDAVARQRDRVAEERDRVAEEHDRDIKGLGEELGSDDPRARKALEALAEMRDRSAAYRMRAAADRARAARDREVAAEDRKHLLAELERAHMDDLTGTYRRGMGEIALVNEIERARRSGHGLSLAYIDCDALKAVNDRGGHAAGDDLLRELVAVLRSKLRPYDPIVRWGGDEFVCTISDANLEEARRRFEGIRAALVEATGEDVTVGLAGLEEGDSLETLLARADAALLEARRGR
jgi:diguanylate cyclase (GGDEF)-like protein